MRAGKITLVLYGTARVMKTLPYIMNALRLRGKNGCLDQSLLTPATALDCELVIGGVVIRSSGMVREDLAVKMKHQSLDSAEENLLLVPEEKESINTLLGSCIGCVFEIINKEIIQCTEVETIVRLCPLSSIGQVKDKLDVVK
jgi:hypothetical protein